jgi:hypothetical protein
MKKAHQKSYPYTVDNGQGEFAMLEMPTVVRHIVIPIVYVLGTLLSNTARSRTPPSP